MYSFSKVSTFWPFWGKVTPSPSFIVSIWTPILTSLKPQMSENQMTFSVALDCCVHLFTARFRTHSFQFESFFIEALHKYDYNLVTFGLTSDQAQGTLQSPNPMTDWIQNRQQMIPKLIPLQPMDQVSCLVLLLSGEMLICGKDLFLFTLINFSYLSQWA